MATLRTVIEGTADGQLKIERQARVGISGNAAQRKKQVKAGVQETWRTVDRVIAKNADRLPGKAQDWPFALNLTGAAGASSENNLSAAGNNFTAESYAERAQRAVAKIEHDLSVFQPAQPRRVRVVLEEY